jgi:hypothetical protein
MSNFWEVLLNQASDRGPVMLLAPHSHEWEIYRAYVLSLGETGVADFMLVQAQRGIAWHVKGPLPADNGIVRRVRLRERQKKTGLRILDGGRSSDG